MFVIYLMNKLLMLFFPLQLELLLPTLRRFLLFRLSLLLEQLPQPLARRLLVWERPRQSLLWKGGRGSAGVGVGEAVPHALHRRRLRVLHLVLRLELLSRRRPHHVEPGADIFPAVLLERLPVSVAIQVFRDEDWRPVPPGLEVEHSLRVGGGKGDDVALYEVPDSLAAGALLAKLDGHSGLVVGWCRLARVREKIVRIEFESAVNLINNQG